MRRERGFKPRGAGPFEVRIKRARASAYDRRLCGLPHRLSGDPKWWPHPPYHVVDTRDDSTTGTGGNPWPIAVSMG